MAPHIENYCWVAPVSEGWASLKWADKQWCLCGKQPAIVDVGLYGSPYSRDDHFLSNTQQLCPPLCAV